MPLRAERLIERRGGSPKGELFGLLEPNQTRLPFEGNVLDVSEELREELSRQSNRSGAFEVFCLPDDSAAQIVQLSRDPNRGNPVETGFLTLAPGQWVTVEERRAPVDRKKIKFTHVNKE